MESRLIRRPVAGLLSGRSQCSLSLNASSRRHESSYRRTRSRLNVKPDSSFLLSKDSPKQDHIIFNPPSSAPSVLNTPLKFLPKDDPRAKLFTATAQRHQSASQPLPPPMSPKNLQLPHNHLKEEDIREIFKLRLQDPNVWTTLKLAKKFNCSTRFITFTVKQLGENEKTAARKADMEAKREAIRAKMGPRRTKAKEDKKKRYEAALRDE